VSFSPSDVPRVQQAARRQLLARDLTCDCLAGGREEELTISLGGRKEREQRVNCSSPAGYNALLSGLL